MRKSDLLIGALIAFVATAIGSFLFISLFTDYDFVEGLQIIRSQGNLGKILTLGAILNIIVFFALLRNNKVMMARGVVLGTILLALLTLFI